MPQHANSFYISEAIFLFVRQNSTNTLVYKNAPNVIEDPVFQQPKVHRRGSLHTTTSTCSILPFSKYKFEMSANHDS